MQGNHVCKACIAHIFFPRHLIGKPFREYTNGDTACGICGKAVNYDNSIYMEVEVDAKHNITTIKNGGVVEQWLEGLMR